MTRIHSRRITSGPRERTKVLTLFGTRPEIIKLAPVILALETRQNLFTTLNVTSGQHTGLLYPFVRLFGVRVDHDLNVMVPNQTSNQVCSKVLAELDAILTKENPNAILVQGDTTTALAGALAGFNRRIPVGHVEAGLRSGDRFSPFPEEMNRQLISRLATYHFAATAYNRATLLAEGLSLKQIAQAQGTQHETVRKQLRAIYQKTSTNRQPELLRLLLHLPHNALQQ